MQHLIIIYQIYLERNLRSFYIVSNNIPYTGGCVAIQEKYMIEIMQNIDSSTVMIIDPEKIYISKKYTNKCQGLV